MTSQDTLFDSTSRLGRVLAIICFALASVILILSLVQASHAGAAKAAAGLSLPKSRMLMPAKGTLQPEGFASHTRLHVPTAL